MTDSPKKARVDNTDETTPPLAEKTKSTLAKKIVQPHELGNPDQQSDDEEALSEVASSVDKADACTLALDSILQKLPDNVSEYIRDNLPSGAQADVASLLVSKNLVTKSMIGLLDDTSCKELAHLLSDRTNLIFLKAVGRNCGALHSLKRKADDTRSESGLGPDSVAKLQSKFKAKYGMAIPGRFTVDGQVLSKIKKNELVRLAECDEPGPLSKKKRLVIDPLGKSVNLEDIGLPRAPYQCEAAHVGACITRFCLSAAMLGKMTPTEGLIYMARLFEVGEKTSVHTIRSADLGMRLEAVRGGYDDASSLGQRLASGQADILAACRAEGRSVSFASSASSTNRPRSHQRGDEPCRLYMRGKCHYGSNCKYRHDRSRGRQGERSSNSKRITKEE
ncbi:hypothetical protein Pmar_PMAR011456 [Perkinsus marinus ATCC 50983]|uniref:C3H1-type domain-containing protein n=1 Tax=Perkinsus marinus (strain ATCC 50983 / TXsc) TaxID=423536 RepID=C5LHJ5_PERM5|nr:hypothetical protein Pmar_PMAR011456 [Perkinsus marinus ATCC 50983]EER03798.1 hypothetical protein Pmar_PMAR011456 [Perkinsus marinus ATCC 50983]|eukprot:XP_002771982.1 hypothetical protein Pmar_PMAR011456 [Perkinsus marinus ATCC 50983]